MTQLIHFDQLNHTFTLSNQQVTYIMEINATHDLVHRYWGHPLTSYHFSNRPQLKKRTFAATPDPKQPELSPDFLPFECPLAFQGDYRSSAVQIQPLNAESPTRYHYQSYQIKTGAVDLPTLPHARESQAHSETLIITLYDDMAKVQLNLYYTIFADSAVIVRSVSVKNKGNQTIQIQRLLSASIDTPYDHQQLTTFHGTHQKEFQLDRAEIDHGTFKIGCTRGASGPQYPPYVALSQDATEFTGDVHALSLIYSGNHEISIERDQYDQLRLQIGLNSDTSTWNLAPGDSFQSPQALLNYSSDGFNGNSQNFHHFLTTHLLPPFWRQRKRPLLINSWEMSGFQVNDSLIRQLIDAASELGFEMVVLDDGWYRGRNNSRTSLGDWTADQQKFPNGLKPLVAYAKQKGLKFGLWFEPEMISPKTALIKAHPDWVMRSQSYAPILGRGQYYLDLTNPAVQAFIIDTLSKTIDDLGLAYIKWDMNRHMTDPFSQDQHLTSSEYTHRYWLGLYHVIDQLTTKYPQVLFENCSSGGGRLDPGMAYYFPQTWLSDNTDGFDRQQIQYGASYLFPPSTITGHISAIPNLQTGRKVPFATRAALAASTNLGYEMPILNLTDTEKKTIQNQLKVAKQERSLLTTSRFYRLQSPFNSDNCAWMFVTPTTVLIYAFNNRYHVDALTNLIKLPGLEPNASYQDCTTQQIYSGSELIHCGLALPIIKGDFTVQKIKLTKLEMESD